MPTPAPVELTREQARRIAVRAQLLDARRPGDVVEVAEQLTAIKIDPTATIAPCEHTVLWTRIGFGYDPPQLTKAVRDRLLFEQDGAFRPTSLLPLMLPRMRAAPLRESTVSWLEANDAFRRELLARLRAEGPLPASAIPDTAAVARESDGWYGPNQVPRMLEVLAYRGEVAVAGREGRTRLWDLPERVWPAEVFADPLPEAEAAAALAARILAGAGIAKQKSPWTRVAEAGLPARVEGSSWTWRVDPEALAAVEEPFEGRVAFLNPYDAALFDRPRLKELFGFAYVLEQFKKPAERVYGFFAHPILDGDRFVGMLEAVAEKDRPVLRVAAVHEFAPVEAEQHARVTAEIDALAEWLGLDVRYGDEPEY